MDAAIKNSAEELQSELFNRKKLGERFRSIRKFSHKLASPLVVEDYCIQSMPDVSPTKWHLAHTSWFFETFVIKEADKNYKSSFPQYDYLFNSYYVLAGERFSRPIRGLLSRPAVKDVYNYREHIDNLVDDLILNSPEEFFLKMAPVIEIGINHEQQHQELILTDIKHVFSINPLHPVYIAKTILGNEKSPEFSWKTFEGGLVEIGHNGDGFSYDNETPVHKEYLNPFAISSRLVTNEEYIEFINSGGYKKAELWLSDGFAKVETENWNAPLYWEKHSGEWWNFTLSGFRRVEPGEPVCHVSFYEADAFARWKGLRLPTEAEWEVASGNISITGNFVEEENYHPVPVKEESSSLSQMYGDVWEWTLSPYSPYPGYKPLPGALGEYNGKFMSNQMVLRGGSCATSQTHIRKTYRNFFPPHSRWQFMGLRLAKDL